MSVPPYGGPAIPRRRRGTARLTRFDEFSDIDSSGEPAISGARPGERCSLSRTLSVRPHAAHRQKKRLLGGILFGGEGGTAL